MRIIKPLNRTTVTIIVFSCLVSLSPFSFAVNENISLTFLDKNNSQQFGSTVAVNKNVAVIADKRGNISIYRFNGLHWQEESKLLIPRNNELNLQHVNINLEEDLLVVGDYSANQHSGAVYIYRYNGSHWLLEQSIYGKTAFSHFAYSVSLSENRIAVGARLETLNGAVYLYKYDNKTWKQETKMVADKTEAATYFGHSLALHKNQLLIGAPMANRSSGKVYYYTLDNRQQQSKQWHKQQTIINTSPEILLGYNLAIDENTLAISSFPFEDKLAASGAVYVYEKKDHQWILSSTIKANDALHHQHGLNLSLKNSRLAIASWSYFVEIGSVFIYEKLNNRWQQSQQLEPSVGMQHDGFSFSLSLDENLTVVGAPFFNNGAGTAYLYYLENHKL